MILKIAVIGCGGIANGVHMPSILKYKNEYGNLQIVACADIDGEKAKIFAEKYNIERYFLDYNEMLNTAKPDAAVCFVSETVMSKVAADVLHAGVHALIEKPPGLNPDELNHIINAAKSNENVKIMVAFNRRHAPVYIKLKDLCETQKMRHIIYGMHRIKRHDRNFETTAIHAVDAVKWLAGSDYSKVRIEYQDMPEKGINVANFYIYGEFENGVTAQINILVSTGRVYEGCQISCDDSIYYADFISNNSNNSDNSADYGIKEYANNNNNNIVNIITQNELCGSEYIDRMGFYNEHKTFYDAIKQNISIPSIPQSAIQNVLICETIKNRVHFLEWLQK